MKGKSRLSRLGVNLLTAALAATLALGGLELIVRTFIPCTVGPAFTVYDPIYGKRLRANLHEVRLAPEFRFEINTNSLGMRDPEPTKPLTDGIVFVGDSFTMGYGVNDNEAFPALIRSALESRGVTVPIVNYGLGDNGNGRWVKFFEHDAVKFRPRIVVFQIMANDFDDNLAEHLFELDSNGRLRELPIGPPSLLRKLSTLVDRVPALSYSYLVGLAWTAAKVIEDNGAGRTGSTLGDDSFGRGEHKYLASDELTFALVRTSVDKALAGGADVIGLLVELTGHRRARMLEIFRERGLTCFDAPNQKEAPGLFYQKDGHWNAAGHRRAADLLLPEILRRVGKRRNSLESSWPSTPTQKLDRANSG